MTNKAAIGYMIIAAKVLSLDKNIIRDIDDAMQAAMDLFTEKEAEKAFLKGVDAK